MAFQRRSSGILTDEQRKALENAFDDLDVDKSGTINRRELKAGLQIIGQIPTTEEMDFYFKRSYGQTSQEEDQVPQEEQFTPKMHQLPQENDKSMQEREFTKQEFVDFIETYVPLKTQSEIDEELVNAFAKFDTNKDFLISKDEFRKVMTEVGDDPLTQSEMDKLFDNLKANGQDGENIDVKALAKLFTGDEW